MKIDGELVRLVEETDRKLAALSDPSPSWVLAMKKYFVEEAASLIERAGERITDAEKIAAFDALLDHHKNMLLDEINTGYRDDDADHYAFEGVMEAVFGDEIFTATNAFARLVPDADFG